MSLLINQGIQDTSQDGKFSIIVAKNVTAQITKLELSIKKPGTLIVTMKIFEGAYKGRQIIDYVSFLPTDSFSWKYRALRAAAGVPYNKGEPTNIDIERLLLNKAITVDLGSRKDKNDDEWQSITYKTKKTDELTPAPTPLNVGTTIQEPIKQQADFPSLSTEDLVADISTEDDPW